MTIAVQVSNLGDRDVNVFEVEYDKRSGKESIRDRVILMPKESRTFHVHLLRDIRIEELP